MDKKTIKLRLEQINNVMEWMQHVQKDKIITEQDYYKAWESLNNTRYKYEEKLKEEVE
jgi:DNA repair ATPase RecN